MATIVKNLIEISGLADSLPQNPTIFKQLTLQETGGIPDAKPDVEKLIKGFTHIEITYTKVIRTPVGKSLEGQVLTGYKLLVQGESIQKIEYVADESAQSIHTAYFNVPFSTFIVLPSNFIMGTPVTVTPYIENIYLEMTDKRILSGSIILLLDATF